MHELQPGYFWQGGYRDDIRKRAIFNRDEGYFAYFRKAKFVEDQEFSCYASRSCGFRVIRFSVGSTPCQWVYFNPDIGTTDGHTGRSITPFSVELVHCGEALSFQRNHFDATPDKVSIRFPGDASDPDKQRNRRRGETASVCRMALNGRQDSWQTVGFGGYVKIARGQGLSIADCRRILRIHAEETKAKAVRKPDSAGAGGNSFTNCFDNPASCK